MTWREQAENQYSYEIRARLDTNNCTSWLVNQFACERNEIVNYEAYC